MGVIDIAAGKALSSSAVFLFITVLLLAGAKRISTAVVLFSIQSAVISAQAMATAYLERSGEAWAVAVMVFLVKVLGIPFALFRLVERLKTARDVKSSTTAAQSVFIAAIMIFLSYLAVRPYARDVGVTDDALASAVALILTGAFLMVSRKKALMQILGLLVLENGIFLAALSTRFGMPLIIEIGVFFDILMGVFIMGIFVFRIRDTFEHMDVSRLRNLRG